MKYLQIMCSYVPGLIKLCMTLQENTNSSHVSSEDGTMDHDVGHGNIEGDNDGENIGGDNNNCGFNLDGAFGGGSHQSTCMSTVFLVSWMCVVVPHATSETQLFTFCRLVHCDATQCYQPDYHPCILLSVSLIISGMQCVVGLQVCNIVVCYSC